MGDKMAIETGDRMATEIVDQMTLETADMPSEKAIDKIKENLTNIQQTHGCLGLSQLIIKKFHTAGFKFYGPAEEKKRGGADNLPIECTMHQYLDKTSRSAKTMSGNQKKKQKKLEQKTPGLVTLPTVMKTDVELGGNPMKTIDDLEYSDTTEIYNLGDIEHKRAFEAVRINAFTKEILNPGEAVEHLKTLDIHMLLNVAQHSLLKFNLTDNEKMAIQALRVSRNGVVHAGKLPTIRKLQNIQLLMMQALPRINDKSLWKTIKEDCSAALSVLDSNVLADELRAELIANHPSCYIFDRKFTIHNEGYRDTPMNISWLCDKVAGLSSSGSLGRLVVAGSAASGRTHALLAIYQHWAVQDSSLNKAFKVVLPMIDRYQQPDTNESKSKSGIQYRVEKSLQQWAPNCLAKHGFEHLNKVMGGFTTSDCLVLLDQCNGYFVYSSSWNGPCIETGFLNKKLLDQDSVPDERSLVRGFSSSKNSMEQMIAQLLPLKDSDVEYEVSRGDNSHSTEFETLYHQFQDKPLLTCPQALGIFKNVTSSVIDNLELTVMKEIISEGHEWVMRKFAAFNKDLMVPAVKGIVVDTVTMELKKIMCQQVYDHKLSGNPNYDVKYLPFLPSYLMGPIEGPLMFKSNMLEEYLAALHVVENADVAAWKWLKNTPRFKRVFKFVVQMWEKQDTFREHEMFFTNYLSVLLGLHRYDHRTAYKNSKEDWNKPRPNDWTLEKEGFIRLKEDTYFKKWGLLSHVYDASGGDPFVLKSLLRVLSQFDVWGIEFDKMSPLVISSLQNIFQKLVASVQRDSDGREKQTKVLIKLSGSAGRPDDLPAVLEALQQLKQLPCQLKVMFYYKQKDPKYGFHDHLSLRLKQSMQRLVYNEIPILSYSGPFLLPAPSSLSQCSSLKYLQEANLTVYDRATLLAFLGACPSCLRYLSLNVDLTKQPSGPQSSSILPAGLAMLSPDCRVRLALRYYGSLEIMSVFSIFPRIHVLRLHGFYPPDRFDDRHSTAQELFTVKDLNVDCLFVKFAAECKRKDTSNGEVTSAELLSVWPYDLLLGLAQNLPSVSRFIISRLPGRRSYSIPSLIKQLQAKLPSLQRLLFHDAVVSQSEVCEALSFVDQSSSQCPPFSDAVCKPRFDREKRERLAANKPPGFELQFIDVCDLLPTNWSDTATPIPGTPSDLNPDQPIPSVDMQMGYYYSGLSYLVKLVNHSSLPLFCYDGHRACLIGQEHAQEHRHGPALRILCSPTRDLRLHLHLNWLTDEVVFAATSLKESVSEGSLSHRLRAMLPILAAIQYLHLQVGPISVTGFLTLAEAVRAHKQQQLALQTTPAVPPQVDPFSLTVISMFDDVLITKKRPKVVGGVDEAGPPRRGNGSVSLDSACRSANDRASYIEMVCENLQHSLPALSYLSYSVFKMVHARDTDKVLCSVTKTHAGGVFVYKAR